MGEGFGAPAAGSGMGARADRAIVIAVVAVRATFVVQLILAVVDGAGRVGRPGLFVGLGPAMVVESVLLCVFLLRRRALTPTAAVVDLAVIAGMILAEPLCSGAADRVGTWVAWAFGAGAAGALATGPVCRCCAKWSRAGWCWWLPIWW